MLGRWKAWSLEGVVVGRRGRWKAWHLVVLLSFCLIYITFFCFVDTIAILKCI